MQRDGSSSELEAELERHRGLVQATAFHYAKRCREPLDDLTQEGWIGFLRAYQRSTRQRDRPLGAYAKPFIRGAILRYLRDKSQLVRLPRSTQERLQALKRLRRDAEVSTPDGLTFEALRRLTGWSSVSLMALERAELLIRLLPLEGEDCCEGTSLDSEGARLDGLMASHWLASIPKRHRHVVELVVLEGMSLRGAAHILGISAATVRRRLQLGLSELRIQLNPASDARGCSRRR